MSDAVNHPAHYTFSKDLEVIDFLTAWFPFCPLLWQVGKYIARLGRKDSYLQDLSKARWCLARYEESEISKRALPPTKLKWETVFKAWNAYLDPFQMEVLARLSEYFLPKEKRSPLRNALSLIDAKIEDLQIEEAK